MPKVSICIPAYQQVTHLSKTLTSVLEQSFTDYELIVTDDSPDNSVKTLLDTFNFGGRLSYFKNTPRLGSPANWNYAMQQARGEYIKILHHDDFFTTANSLQLYIDLLDKNPEALFAFSGTVIKLLELDTTWNYACSARKLKKLLKHPNTLFFGNIIGGPSATIVRNQQLLFDTQLKWLVDTDWYIQLIKRGPVAYTEKTLICTVQGAKGQITQSVLNDKAIQVKEHIYLFGKLIVEQQELKKFSVFFQLLFHKHQVNTLEQLKVICAVPEKLEHFFKEVLKKKNKNIFFKKLKYWYKKTSFKDYLFIIKNRFK